jgi:hypothetical protein
MIRQVAEGGQSGAETIVYGSRSAAGPVEPAIT